VVPKTPKKNLRAEGVPDFRRDPRPPWALQRRASAAEKFKPATNVWVSSFAMIPGKGMVFSLSNGENLRSWELSDDVQYYSLGYYVTARGKNYLFHP